MGDRSEYQNRFVISEVYDILSSNAPLLKTNEGYLLKRVSDVANLKEVCFRSFKPIMKRSIQNNQNTTASVSIYPAIWTIDGDEPVTPKFNGFNIYNRAYGVNAPVTKSVRKCEFAGDIEGLLDNINETIAGYCDDIKSRNASFRFTNADETVIYDLKYLGNIVDIDTYYRSVIPANDDENVTNPERKFVKLKYNSDDEEFLTENVIFNLEKVQGDDSWSELIYLVFITEVNFEPYDVFNVSPFRQYFNCIDYMRSQEGYYIKNNDCISTNVNFKDIITANNYRFNGLDLVLRCGLMRNLTSIVYVNETEAQIVMKGFNEQSSTNYVPIQITDLNGNVVDEDYLRDIYSSILVDIDFVFDGLM